MLALCQYHEDKDPSFSIRKRDTVFHCWACNAKGDAIKLVMDLDNVDFTTAVNKLAAISGYKVTDDYKLEYIKKKLTPIEEETEEHSLIESPRLYQLNRWATDELRNQYSNSLAQKYLNERGFNDDVAQQFGLGYYHINNDYNGFLAEAERQGFTKQELIVAGFLAEYQDGIYERFLNRLVFPIFNYNRNIIAFSGRALTSEQLPKYTATANSEFYKKGFFLYGLQFTQRNSPLVLVEGNLDCIRLIINDINTVAQLGTALTKHQCQLIKFLTDDVTLLYDGDDAGRKTSYTSILPLVENGVYVKVVILPDGNDPDTFVKNFGVNTLKDMLTQNRKKGLAYLLCESVKHGRQPERVLIDCLKSINKIVDPVIKACYIEDASSVFGFSEEALRAELGKV